MVKWKTIKLGKCIQEVVDKTTKNNQYQVLSVTKDGIYSQDNFFKKQIASENNIGYKIIRKNNLVFSSMNLWMGSLDVLTNYDIGIVSPSYKIFKFNEAELLPQYAKYFMRSNNMMQLYKDFSAQGASIVRRNLDLKSLLNTKVQIPTIEEQKKIADILLKVDEIIEKLEVQIKQRKLEKKWVMKKIFSKEKSQYEISKNKTWKECKIRDLLELLTDYDANGSFSDVAKNVRTYNKQEYAWYVRMTDLEKNTPITDVKYVDKQSYQFLKKTKLYGNELLIAKRGDIGKVYIFKMKTAYATLGPNTYLLKLNDKVYPEFLYYYFQSQTGQRNLNRINSATSLGAIYKEDVKNINIKLPEKKEQKEFIKILYNIDNQIKLLEQKNKEYQNLKKGLMQKLLTGKVRVKI